ncbi:uncharacterized protein LOC128629562 [Ictalurus punctatus]|uniref:Uncharacterized protein LOC128629562 n=1 Tax=Ictalurus punctatus TaxID=7998 RepID=A0A9F7R1D1_ICTPU|nr:uncharacterized protein LOC128629562 [Ictalurus punctatus]
MSGRALDGKVSSLRQIRGESPDWTSIRNSGHPGWGANTLQGKFTHCGQFRHAKSDYSTCLWIGGGNQSTRRKPPKLGGNMQTRRTQDGDGIRTPDPGDPCDVRGAFLKDEWSLFLDGAVCCWGNGKQRTSPCPHTVLLGEWKAEDLPVSPHCPAGGMESRGPPRVPTLSCWGNGKQRTSPCPHTVLLGEWKAEDLPVSPHCPAGGMESRGPPPCPHTVLLRKERSQSS